MIVNHNYDFKFPIVRTKRKQFYRILQVVLISSALWTFIYSFFFLNRTIENQLLRILEVSPIGIFLLSMLTLVFYSNLTKNFKLVGSILMSDTHIKITLVNLTYEYLLTDVKNIKITYYGSEGDQYRGYINSMVFKEGTRNYLEFEEMNGAKHSYEFYVEKEVRLKQAILTMESRHIAFEVKNFTYK